MIVLIVLIENIKCIIISSMFVLVLPFKVNCKPPIATPVSCNSTPPMFFRKTDIIRPHNQQPTINALIYMTYNSMISSCPGIITPGQAEKKSMECWGQILGGSASRDDGC
jgi:hypothetical protein